MSVKVEIYGNTAIVGAYFIESSKGVAFVFVRGENDEWVQQAFLADPDGESDDWFGCSVDIYGDTVVVGAHKDDDKGPNRGSAFIFVRNGSTWTYQAKLVALVTALQFGVTLLLLALKLG